MVAVCILKCIYGHIHGVVIIKSVDKGVEFDVYIKGIPFGYHGFHIHEKGICLEAQSETPFMEACAHYNPRNKNHGDLNGPDSHAGDLGNIYSNENNVVQTTIVATSFGLQEIIGRSLIVHADKDDLGKGNHADSFTTGHSGKRILCGIIVNKS